MKWHLPAGWQVSPSAQTNLMLTHYIGGLVGIGAVEFTLTPGELTEARYDLLLDISSQGHHTRLVIPVTLLSAAAGTSY